MKKQKLHIIDAASLSGKFEADLRLTVNEIELVKMRKEGTEAMMEIIERLELIANHPFIKHYQGIKAAFEDLKQNEAKE